LTVSKGKKELLIGDESFDYFKLVGIYEAQVKEKQSLLV
jgi:hypothetical protein